jgi:hypothetical protein
VEAFFKALGHMWKTMLDRLISCLEGVYLGAATRYEERLQGMK